MTKVIRISPTNAYFFGDQSNTFFFDIGFAEQVVFDHCNLFNSFLFVNGNENILLFHCNIGPTSFYNNSLEVFVSSTGSVTECIDHNYNRAYIIKENQDSNDTYMLIRGIGLTRLSDLPLILPEHHLEFINRSISTANTAK